VGTCNFEGAVAEVVLSGSGDVSLEAALNTVDSAAAIGALSLFNLLLFGEADSLTFSLETKDHSSGELYSEVVTSVLFTCCWETCQNFLLNCTFLIKVDTIVALCFLPCMCGAEGQFDSKFRIIFLLTMVMREARSSV